MQFQDRKVAALQVVVGKLNCVSLLYKASKTIWNQLSDTPTIIQESFGQLLLLIKSHTDDCGCAVKKCIQSSSHSYRHPPPSLPTP